MTVYILLFLGAVLAGIPLCSKKCGRSGRIIYCVCMALVFIFISATRFQVGYDYNLYGGTYFNMKYYDITDIAGLRMEKGFLMPLYVLNLAFEDYRTVFIFTSLIIYSAVFFMICRESSNPWISVAAYLCFGLFFNSLCFLRQTIAALMVAYATKYVGEKRPLRFAALVIAASVFHWSALVMLVMYLFLRIKPGKIYLAVVSVGTVLFCIFSKTLMYWFIDNFYMYRGYDPESNAEAVNGLPLRYTIMFGILFAVAFAFRRRLTEKNPNNSVYINCLMFTTVFEAMGVRHGILSRFALLVYIPPILFLIPDLVQVIREYIGEKLSSEKRRRIVSVCVSAAGFAFAFESYIMLMLSNYNGTVPYVSQLDRPGEIFVEEVLDDGTDEWNDEDWEDIADEEWFDEEFADETADEGASDDTLSDNSTADESADEDWDDESWDEEAFEDDVLSQLE